MISIDTIYETQSFPNAWYRALRYVKNNGTEINFGGKLQGKDQHERKTARDCDLTIVLEKNALKEALEGKLHPQFPTKEAVKNAYLKEWDRGYDWRAQGFTYCYEDRCEAWLGVYPLVNTNRGTFNIDQWKLAKRDLANQIETGIMSNRNVIVIGNPSIDRYQIPDSPPCLREIWIRHEGNRKVSVKWLFRSRDLAGAWMTNIIGLLSAVQREVIEPNDCEIVQAVDKNHSLHVYKGDWDMFDTVKPVSVLASGQ